MKKLEIRLTLSRHNEAHSIFLGDENLKHFSKTYLKEYLRLYKKTLMDNIRILNLYNSQIDSIYRSHYFDLSLSDTHYLTEKFHEFDKSFNWIFNGHGENSNGIIFSKIDKCIANLRHILVYMKIQSQKNKNYVLKNHSVTYLKIVEDFESQYEKDKRSLNLKRKYEMDVVYMEDKKNNIA